MKPLDSYLHIHGVNHHVVRDPEILKRVEVKPVSDVQEVIRLALVCEPPVIADSPLTDALPVPAAGAVKAYRGL